MKVISQPSNGGVIAVKYSKSLKVMIQSGIHLAPLLRHNPFELQSGDDGLDFVPPSLRFALSLPPLPRANPSDRYGF